MASQSSAKPPLSPSHERQVRLLLRILEAPRPLTATEIYSSVEDYRERFDPNGDKSSLEKMFERDRDALAQTGIEIGTVPDPTAPGDRARWRYQVVQDAAGGASFDLTAEEILLVNEATAAWLDPELRTGARKTFVKLLGQGDSGGVVAASAPRTVVSTPPLFRELRDAVAHQRRIGFDYLKLGGVVAERRDIDALALFSHRGRWLLHGFDHTRGASRNFLLKRMLGVITVAGTHDRDQVSSATLTAELDRLATTNPVRVLVRTRSEAEVRLRARASESESRTSTTDHPLAWRELVIYDWDLGLLADELAGLGTMVRVLEPRSVVEGVRERLQRVIEAHEDVPEAAHE